MNSPILTERLQRVLQIARDEAARRHHGYVGTEHILLAIMAEGQGVGAATLVQLGVVFGTLREEIDSRVRTGDRVSASQDLPYNEDAQAMFEMAASEARELRHAFVGTEHILLGILRDRNGLGARILTDAGVTIEAARREVRLLIGEGFD